MWLSTEIQERTEEIKNVVNKASSIIKLLGININSTDKGYHVCYFDSKSKIGNILGCIDKNSRYCSEKHLTGDLGEDSVQDAIVLPFRNKDESVFITDHLFSKMGCISYIEGDSKVTLKYPSVFGTELHGLHELEQDGIKINWFQQHSDYLNNIHLITKVSNIHCLAIFEPGNMHFGCMSLVVPRDKHSNYYFLFNNSVSEYGILEGDKIIFSRLYNHIHQTSRFYSYNTVFIDNKLVKFGKLRIHRVLDLYVELSVQLSNEIIKKTGNIDKLQKLSKIVENNIHLPRPINISVDEYRAEGFASTDESSYSIPVYVKKRQIGNLEVEYDFIDNKHIVVAFSQRDRLYVGNKTMNYTLSVDLRDDSNCPAVVSFELGKDITIIKSDTQTSIVYFNQPYVEYNVTPENTEFYFQNYPEDIDNCIQFEKSFTARLVNEYCKLQLGKELQDDDLCINL